MSLKNIGIQCPACWSLRPNDNTWDTKEHRDKYHKGKQGKSRPYSNGLEIKYPNE